MTKLLTEIVSTLLYEHFRLWLVGWEYLRYYRRFRRWWANKFEGK